MEHIIKKVAESGNNGSITLPKEWVGKKVFVCLEEEMKEALYDKVLPKNQRIYDLKSLLSESDYKRMLKKIKEEAKKEPNNSIGGSSISEIIKDIEEKVEKTSFITKKDMEDLRATLNSIGENELVEKLKNRKE